ncbi:MAG: hypothetical protein V7631_4025 [Massilia sp.]|jgi:hemerythrin
MPAHQVSDNRARAIGLAMRHTHKRLCSRIRLLSGAGDEQFIAGWTDFVAEVEAGFRHEESIMERLGYPALQRHRADNACALRALHRVTPQVETGDTALARQALGALGDILALHRFAVGPLPAGGHLHHMPAAGQVIGKPVRHERHGHARHH